MEKLKLVGLSAAVALLAGWALWVTSPKPDLTSVAWPTSFDTPYVDLHRGKIVAEVSESFALLNALAVLGAGGEGRISGDPDFIRPLLPFRDHGAVALVSEAMRSADFASLAGIFAYSFRDGNLVRTLPHELPAFDRALEQQLGVLESFVRESGYLDFFAENRGRFEQALSGYMQRSRLEEVRSWLEFEFTAVTHDAYRIVASPLLAGEAFSHNFAADTPAYSEIVVFTSLDGDSPWEGADPGLFSAIARHYASRLTDRYIRIVNRVFANIAIWSPGDLNREPAEIFNDYMTWGSYVLYVGAVDPDALAAVSESVARRMESMGYPRFTDFLDRLLAVYGARREGERLGMLYPKVVREAIRLARDYESL